MSIQIVKKLTGEIKTPRRSTENSAGYDVFASYSSLLEAKQDTYFTLPVGLSFNENTHRAFLFVRSSIGIKKNIRFVEDGNVVPCITLMSNIDGIEKTIVLRNIGEEDFLLENGMHFAQIIITDKINNQRNFLLEKVEQLQGTIPVSMSVLQKENFKQTLVLEEPISIKANESYLVASGYKAKVDEDAFLGGYVPENEQRFKYSNGVGIIDSDYYNNEDNEGLMFFKIDNVTDEELVLGVGTEIVDLVCVPFYLVEDEIVPTAKRTGGVGSTTEKLAKTS